MGLNPAWVKSKTKKLVFDGSPLSRQHQGVRAKISLPEIRIMCPSAAICLIVYYCTSVAL